jgi:thiamine pyrophosphate-dependent acetolactate synthase large subunit-like protein
VIAIAHGFAKVTEKPMLCAIHANVGLMHATMAIYNGQWSLFIYDEQWLNL